MLSTEHQTGLASGLAKSPAQTNAVLAAALSFRDESVMFVEALFALDKNPGQQLIPPATGQGHTRVPLIPYKTAVRAITAHLYKHVAASLARCIRAALAHLWERSWLQINLTAAAAAGDGGQDSSSGGSKGAQSKGPDSSGGSGSKGVQSNGPDSSGGSGNKGVQSKGPDSSGGSGSKGVPSKGPSSSGGGSNSKALSKAVQGLDLEQSQIELHRVSDKPLGCSIDPRCPALDLDLVLQWSVQGLASVIFSCC